MIDRFHKGRAFTMTHELKTKLPLTVNLSFEYEISGIDLEQSRQFANRVSSQIYEVNIHEQDHHKIINDLIISFNCARTKIF